jgi:hypothetical protein
MVRPTSVILVERIASRIHLICSTKAINHESRRASRVCDLFRFQECLADEDLRQTIGDVTGVLPDSPRRDVESGFRRIYVAE